MKNKWPIIWLACLFVFLCGVSLSVGSYHMPFKDIIKTLVFGGDVNQNLAIWGIRLPRLIMAVIVGVALALSGTVMQGVTRNPLAEPGIVGVNSGATFAVVLFLSFQNLDYYQKLNLSTMLALPILAILGGLVATFIIWQLALKRGKLNTSQLVLMGVGVNVALSAIVVLLQLNMSRGRYNQALNWISGSLWGTNFTYIAILLPLILLLSLGLTYKAKVLDVLLLGENTATVLGVSVAKEVKTLLLLAVLLASSVVATVGNIAFVGLLAPHFAEKLVGARHMKKLPMAALVGAMLMIVADLLSRNLFSPLEIPIGIMLSLIGVPYFIYLLLKEK